MACASGAAAVTSAAGAASTSLVLLNRPPGSAILRFREAAAGSASFAERLGVAGATAAA